MSISKKSKKLVSTIALVLILVMVLGMVAGALTGCGTSAANDDVTIRVAALKGPTTIGVANLIEDSKNGDAEIKCDFEMYTQGSDIMAAMVAGNVDIGLVPSNVACVMNSKVEGGVSVIDINTLSVLNCVTADESVTSLADLDGRTVYSTGQGATPEYTLRYLLEKNGINNCRVEFKS